MTLTLTALDRGRTIYRGALTVHAGRVIAITEHPDDTKKRTP